MQVRLLISRASSHSAATSSDSGGSFLPLPWVEAAHSLAAPSLAIHGSKRLERSQSLNSELPHHDSSQAICLKKWKRTVLTLPFKSMSCSPLSAGLWPLFPQPLIHVHMAHHGDTWSILPGTTLDWHRFLDILHTIAKHPYPWVSDSARGTQTS